MMHICSFRLSEYDIGLLILRRSFHRTRHVQPVAGYFPLKTTHGDHHRVLAGYNDRLFAVGMGHVNKTHPCDYYTCY